MQEVTHAEAHDQQFEFVAGRLCLDFANTINFAVPNPNERLKGYADLLKWSRLAGLVSEGDATALARAADERPALAQAALDEARALRRSLHRLFAAAAAGVVPAGEDVEALNAALGEGLAHLKVGYGGTDFEWVWVYGEPGLNRMLGPVVWSAAELLTEGQLERVSMCDGEGCSWLFLDTSKNHSRRWCSMADCGNRAKARRYYARQRGEDED